MIQRTAALHQEKGAVSAVNMFKIIQKVIITESELVHCFKRDNDTSLDFHFTKN